MAAAEGVFVLGLALFAAALAFSAAVPVAGAERDLDLDQRQSAAARPGEAVAELAFPDHALGIGQPAAGGLTSGRTGAASACLPGERFGACTRLPFGVGEHVRLPGTIPLKAPSFGGDVRATEEINTTLTFVGKPVYSRVG